MTRPPRWGDCLLELPSVKEVNDGYTRSDLVTVCLERGWFLVGSRVQRSGGMNAWTLARGNEFSRSGADELSVSVKIIEVQQLMGVGNLA